MSTFEACFEILIGHEGGYTLDRADPGNWTRGAVGRGRLLGTKFGIAAASYPTLAIASLTLAQAQAIYRTSYWTKVSGDLLPPRLALLTFDTAVNNGVGRAVLLLQAAVGVPADGSLGSGTLNAIGRADQDALCAEFLARRLVFMAGLGTWRTFGLGWARRLCALPIQAMRLATPSPAGAVA